MNTESTCPRCGAEVPDDAPRGLCPRCLINGALAGDTQAEPPPPSAMKTPSPEELSAVFPQLEVFEWLGSGGMGRVYKARQTHLDRLVALKILPPELASDPAFAERFAREARALAKLNHPHIVQCYDFGRSQVTADGVSYFYLLLEFVDGVNLRQTMQAGTLSAREALGIVPRLADALHYAHEQGVLHRDIKPENILIDKQGRVKIADFGLARFQNNDGKTDAMTLTMSGAQLGTAAYMAPEQIEQPHAVDHRADIYSLGVVFYEMLTGELPLGRFAAPSETSGVDPRLDSVVFRTLEKQKERRYQSAEEVQSQVETIAGSPTTNPNAAFSSADREEPENALHTGAALAFPPSWTGTFQWWLRQPWLLQRGRLILQAEQLLYQSDQAELTIPIDVIESVSLAPLPFAVEPLGRCPISVRWKDATGRIQTTCFLVGESSWFTSASRSHTVTDRWVKELCRAAARRQGRRVEIDADRQPACATAIPSAPSVPKGLWFIPVIAVAVILLTLAAGGAWFLAIPLGILAAFFGVGIWRQAPTDTLSNQATEAETPEPSVSPPSAPRQAAAPEPLGAETSAEFAPSPPLRKGAQMAWKGTQNLAKVTGKAGKSAARAAAGTLKAVRKSPEESETTDEAPRNSAWALWAFGFATIGWGLLFIGPLVGCVLGWIALARIEKSEKPLKGRGMALFAALQAPLVLIVGALGASAYALWAEDLLPIPFAFGILALAAAVFFGLRLVFRMARLNGLWAWRKKAGMAVVLFAFLSLSATTWILEDLRDEWPLNGTLSTAFFTDPSGSPGAGRALAASIEEGAHGEWLRVSRPSRRSSSVRVSVATEYRGEGLQFLDALEDETAKRYPGIQTSRPAQTHSGWHPDGPKGEELFVTFAAIGCAAGLCFAFAGFGPGLLGLLLALGTSIALYEIQAPSPIGYPLLDPTSTAIFESANDPTAFPTRVDGIRLH